ncbi:MAG TPA: isoprenyl transferase [Syntrophales bacterium]|jgi:undecaprenyl diphosphate synthase|nr:isoprenyl transferase [Syntrophales bacterium]HOU77111.1 isoprenyl transferase [Syntrophales bacterium]HPC32791.1 isoprenyl transferase [Syntrophales bacterium]HQG33639.1 isoprenyl transferase [Syntrophales bacterium]HQI35788.1 isoprenyl transferase [Syntrophales bacterium]
MTAVIDFQKLPRHIAIIMDGNGRWAKQHALGRIMGHQRGVEAVRKTVRLCREIGIKYLTLYAFSVENWSRPDQEVAALMKILRQYLQSELAEMMDNDIRLHAIGNIDGLQTPVRNLLLETMARTAGNRSMVLSLALSYGGQDEIVQAVRRIAGDVREGKVAVEEITRERFAAYLYTAGLPDPDLLIRTSGEYRISNFLLWQSAYTEFYFTDVLWPDFNKDDLFAAIADYQRRERRYGLTSDQIRKDGAS